MLKTLASSQFEKVDINNIGGQSCIYTRFLREWAALSIALEYIWAGLFIYVVVTYITPCRA